MSDEGIDQEEANFYHDERRQRLVHEGNRMSNIEPTEEQKATARDLYNNLLIDFNMGADIRPPEALARLLAEREAKLRKQLAFMEAGSQADYNAFAEALQKEDAYLAEINLINERLAEMREVDGRKSRMLYDRDVVIDTLRARVAELEIYADTAMRNRDAHAAARDELEERETQHLADIKALHQFLGDHEEEEGIWIPRSEFKDMPCREYLDDAKAAEGGESTEHVVMLSHDHAGNDTVDALCEKMVWRDCYEATAAVLTRPVAEGMKQQLWSHGNIQILGVKAYLKGVAEQNLADVLWRAAHEVEGVDRLTKGET